MWSQHIENWMFNFLNKLFPYQDLKKIGFFIYFYSMVILKVYDFGPENPRTEVPFIDNMKLHQEFNL
jgi:hypothetical protein